MATFISWNCRGFLNKSSELKDIINKYNPACIALQETYLKTDKHYIRNYKLFSKHQNSDRVSGGVALLAATHIPSMPLTLSTNLQAVAIRIQMNSLVTVCSLYLPPNDRVSQTDLINLISELPSPFIILGDLNGHSPFWGSTDSNARGLQIEHLLAILSRCSSVNETESDNAIEYNPHETIDETPPVLQQQPSTSTTVADKSAFKQRVKKCPVRWVDFKEFYNAQELSSPVHNNLTVDNDLYNSDHIPLIITDNRHNPTNSYRPPKYVLNAANWQKFTSLANINSETIKSSSIEQALSYIVNTIIEAADSSIPKTSLKRRKQNKPWWNAECQQAYKIQRKAWRIFRRYPTTQNFINFKKSRAESRKIQRRSRRASWRKFISGITSTISSRQM
ncbi:hypothetical protein AVEN_131896-1 [Araneus ventricosus]|uniref:Endonuclease/exonuclease/phosphatase domain-containing protein n=1 Tax=Araneus ventricosus TaxID=182803 RepID=A0A4Y2NDM7_ARAVE|nr:hypothetical protein AVEN_131896-1 [Araneus ventricosus]